MGASDSLQVQRIAWGSLTMLRNSLPMLQSRADSLDNFDLSMKKQKVSRCVNYIGSQRWKIVKTFPFVDGPILNFSKVNTVHLSFAVSYDTLISGITWTDHVCERVFFFVSMQMNAADLSPYIDAAPNWPGARSNGKKRTMRKSPPRRQQISVLQDGQSRSKT